MSGRAAGRRRDRTRSRTAASAARACPASRGPPARAGRRPARRSPPRSRPDRRGARASRRASSTHFIAIVAWSSMPAETGRKSRHAGLARWRMSFEQRGQRLLHRREARLLRAMPRQLQRQVRRRRRQVASMQRSTTRAAICTTARPSASWAIASPGMWKLPVESIAPVVDVDERAVGRGVELDFDMQDRVRQRGERGAVHLRHAAEGQRILDAPRRAVRGQAAALRATRGSAPPPPPDREPGARPAPADRAATRWRESPRTTARRRRRAGRAYRARSCSTRLADPTVTALALNSDRPSFAPSTTGARPACASASAPGTRRSADERFAFADQDEREVRERRHVRDADRSPCGDMRIDAAVQRIDQRPKDADQRVDAPNADRDAGAALRHAGDAGEHGGADAILGHRRSDADGPGAHRTHLIERALVHGQRLARVRAQRRREPVNRTRSPAAARSTIARARRRRAITSGATATCARRRATSTTSAMPMRSTPGTMGSESTFRHLCRSATRSRRKAGSDPGAYFTTPLAFRKSRATSFGSIFSPSTL